MVWNSDFLDFLVFFGFFGFPGFPGLPGFPDFLLFLDVPVFPEFGHRIHVPARGCRTDADPLWGHLAAVKENTAGGRGLGLEQRFPGFPGFPWISRISWISRIPRIPRFIAFPGCPGFPGIRASNSGPGAGMSDGCRNALRTSRCRKRKHCGRPESWFRSPIS